MRSAIAAAGCVALSCVIAFGCTTAIRQPELHPPSDARSIRPNVDTLKVHHRSGVLDVLTSWSMDGDSVLTGIGRRYSLHRDLGNPGQFRTPIDSIALLESNNPRTRVSAGKITLGVWSVFWGAITTSCAIDPKSCFGSCPTFYIDDVDANRPRAEGFSSSIARSLEATDLDDLGIRRRGGSSLTVRMTNEAWETHAVRHVKLHAVPVRAGAEVFATQDGAFHEVRSPSAPSACSSRSGDCAAALAARDAVEWQTTTDEHDLAARDTITLVFPAKAGRAGLVLAARQSFVSTYVLYQTMAYLGTNAGSWLARLERGDSSAHRPLNAVNEMIGTVEIEWARGNSAWQRAARYTEAGPIATDEQLIPLGDATSGDLIRVRLTFARGNWRIGKAALVQIGERVAPVTIEPSQPLAPEGAYLFTYPDDEVSLRFDLPRGADEYALFLESRGYYYEWMRGAWLAEGNAAMAALLMFNPREAMRVMTAGFKTREAHFERTFWNSRFGGGRQ